MCTWIGHLRIAENLLTRIPGLDAAQFAIGNVAPDSGIPDAERKMFDPPIDAPYIYFTKEEMDRFIEDTSNDLYRIYEMLWNKHRDVSSLHSSILLLANR